MGEQRKRWSTAVLVISNGGELFFDLSSESQQGERSQQQVSRRNS